MVDCCFLLVLGGSYKQTEKVFASQSTKESLSGAHWRFVYKRNNFDYIFLHFAACLIMDCRQNQ